MAKKRGKKKTVRKERRERRFSADAMTTTTGAFLTGVAGTLGLGAGTYALWIADPPMDFGAILFAVGAGLFLIALWLGEVKPPPVRIGDAGIAIERGGEIVRLPWCDIDRVFLDRNQLVAEGKHGASLPVSMTRQPLAAAWLLREVARRVPDALDVKGSVADSLPNPDREAGESVLVAAEQVAGRHCKASGEPIAFERDARLCPNCAQVYHRSHLPKECATCGAELGQEAIAL